MQGMSWRRVFLLCIDLMPFFSNYESMGDQILPSLFFLVPANPHIPQSEWKQAKRLADPFTHEHLTDG
ncbi:hypothetical protein BRIN106911_09050 [Brevibacillus invocatus]